MNCSRRSFLAAAVAPGVAGCATVSSGGVDVASPLYEADAAIEAVVAPSHDRLYAVTRSTLHAITGTGDRRWRYDRDRPTGLPQVAGGVVYLPTGIQKGMAGGPDIVAALDDASGERRWRGSGYTPFSLLAASDDAVFAGSFDDAISATGEHVFALDAADGETRWTAPSGDAGRGGFLQGGSLYTPFSGRTRAYNAETGDVRWTAPYGTGLLPPRLLGARLVVAGEGLHALSLDDGSAAWSFTGRGYDVDDSFSVESVAVDADEGVVYASDWDGSLWAIDGDSGDARWRHRVGSESVGRVRVDDRRVYTSSAGTVHAVGRDDHASAWTFTPNVSGELDGVHVERVGGTVVVFVASRTASKTSTRLLALDPATGAVVWRSKSYARLRHFGTAGDRLLVGVDERLYAVDESRSLPTTTAAR